MTLSDIEIGRIQGMKLGRRTTVEAIARSTNHSWETINNALLATGGPRGVRKTRKFPVVEARRKLVLKMAQATKTKGGRTIPVYTSAPQIAKALSAAGTPASASMVRRDLAALDFVCRVRRAVPTRDPVVEAARLKHARYWCRPENRRKIPLRVSSDEHTLSINDHTRRTMYVHRTRGVVLPRERRRMQNIPRIMVWAAFGVGFKSRLVVFPQKKTRGRTTRQDDIQAQRGFIRAQVLGANRAGSRCRRSDISARRSISARPWQPKQRR